MPEVAKNNDKVLRATARNCVVFLIALQSFGNCKQLQALETRWNVPTGDWFWTSNWTPFGVPGSFTDALINNGGVSFIQNNYFQSPAQAGVLRVGYVLGETGGSGSLEVTQSGVLSTKSAWIGTQSQGSVEISGYRSQWTIESDLTLGASDGNGELVVSQQAKVAVGGSTTVGGSSAMVLVDGVGTSWISAGEANIGIDGAGKFTISNGASAAFNSTLQVGYYDGSGEVTISGGSVLSSGNSIIGWSHNASGVVTVTDNASKWTISNTLDIGVYGTAELTIAAGGVVSNTIGSIGINADSQGTVVVTGSGSKWTNSGIGTSGTGLFIGVAGTGVLKIEDGGYMSVSRDATIGQLAGSYGLVRVSGLGSHWTTNDRAIFVGENGNGQLVVENGAAVTSAGGRLGRLASSVGNATIRGTDSSWMNSGQLFVGEFGSGQLTIVDGGTVSSGSAALGFLNGGEGTATVTGVGSNWTSGYLTIGNSGIGQLTISDGGRVKSGRSEIGSSSNSDGSVVVAGSGSKWTNSDDLVIGQHGAGALSIRDNGLVEISGDTFIGTYPEGAGALRFENGALKTGGLLSSFSSLHGQGTIDTHGLVSDIDLVFDQNNGLQRQYVLATGESQNVTVNLDVTGEGSLGAGYSGQASLSIADGSSVSSSNGYLGYRLGASGFATVTGPRSTWINTGTLFVGYRGSGEMSIADGASVSSQAGELGHADDGIGRVTVAGSGSSWANSGNLSVGMGNSNPNASELIISNGGAVSSGSGKIGAGSIDPGKGAVTVAGENSSWTVGGSLNVGYSGTGHLTICEQGIVAGKYGSIGELTGSQGYVEIDGSGTAWTNSGNVTIGNSGLGNLSISSGGLLSNALGIIGDKSSSHGTVSVTGANSTWINHGDLQVGNRGKGNLTIAEGASVSSTSGVIGYLAKSEGAARVAGAGTNWISSGNLTVGSSGKGQLSVADGAMVSSDSLSVGSASGSQGVITVSGNQSILASNGLTVGEIGVGTLLLQSGANASISGTTFVGRSGGQGNIGFANGTLTTGDLFASPNQLLGDGTVNTHGLVTDINLTFDQNHGTDQQIFFANIPGQNIAINLDVDGGGSLGAGYLGQGSLTIADGATITSQNGYLGYLSGSTGVAVVSGPGSQWLNSNSLYVAGQETKAAGTGTLQVNDGGRVAAGNLVKIWGKGTLQQRAGGQAIVSSGDLSSVVTNPGIYLGTGAGSGRIEIVSGGKVESTTVILGMDAESIGNATLSNPGSNWMNASSLDVGLAGSGALTINSGSSFSNGDAFIGRLLGSHGTVGVSGANAIWSNSGNVSVGGALAERGGSGSLTISNAGTVNVAGKLIVWDSTGAVTLSGGQLNTGGFDNRGAFNFTSGTLKVASGVFSPSAATSNFTISGASSSNTAALVLDAGANSQNIAQVFVGGVSAKGSIEVLGGATLTTSSGYIASSSFSTGTVNVAGTGSTWKMSGRLSIAGDVKSPSSLGGGTGTLTIGPGAVVDVGEDTTIFRTGTLKLDGGTLITSVLNFRSFAGQLGSFAWNSGTLHVGTYQGNLINSGGILAPEWSLGTTIINGNYTQQAAATLQIEIGGILPNVQFDKLSVLGAANFGGSLQVNLFSGFVPTVGAKFDILDWVTRSGTFSSIRLPVLPAGLVWNSTELYTTGEISIAAAQAGDFDGDGDVDGTDFAAWQANFPKTSGATLALGDADADGDVDGADFVMWQINLPLGPNVDAYPIPEPAAGFLAILALIAHFRRSRKPCVASHKAP